LRLAGLTLDQLLDFGPGGFDMTLQALAFSA
jgi:hypothetical protein